MVDFINGLLVLAHRHKFCYFDADKFLQKNSEASDGVQKQEVTQEMLKTVTLSTNKKIICTQEIGSKESCLVIEDQDSRKIRFLHLKKDS